MMTRYYTTAELAAEFRVNPKTIRAWAADLGIGIDRQGSAGYLYSEADRLRLVESRKPIVKPAPRKRRRAA